MSGPQCCSNPPTLNPNAGAGSAGHVEQLGGLSTYVSGSPNSKFAILLITDIFGYESPLLRKLADKVAASGFYAVVPDFLHGEPFVLNDPNRPLQVWLKDHGTDKGTEEAKPAIEALKSKGFSAVGAAGFCWVVVVELGKTDEHIQAAVILHPSFVTPDDIKGIKVPIAILFSEFGNYSKPELFKQLDDVLASKSDEVDGYVKIFPKVEHGWTVRYNVEDAAAVKSAEEAHQYMLEWFAKYVK